VRALDVAGHKVLLAWNGPWSLAMGANGGFKRVSCGFVGVSDGIEISPPFFCAVGRSIVNVLRQVEVAIADGKPPPAARKESGFGEQTCYRLRKESGGLKVDPAKRLKELEQENSKLKRLVAELSPGRQILQDIARGNFYARSVGVLL
jgi:hypothetical protein